MLKEVKRGINTDMFLNESVPILISECILTKVATQTDETLFERYVMTEDDFKIQIFKPELNKKIPWIVNIDLRIYKDETSELEIKLNANSSEKGPVNIRYKLARKNKDWRIVEYVNTDRNIEEEFDGSVKDQFIYPNTEISEALKRTGEAKWILTKIFNIKKGFNVE